MRLPIGISDFQELIEGDYLFADKTSLIKDIVEDGAKILLITRPRRFGKTLNLSMLAHFFQIHPAPKSNLFAGLAISKETEFCKKHQNQYPVIFISFKDVKKSSYKSAYAEIALLVRDLYREHRYLLENEMLQADEVAVFQSFLDGKASEEQLGKSLRELSEYLSRKFGTPAIILIDEYDTPIQEAYLQGYYEDMVFLMRSMLGSALKDNSSLAKAVLTGITRISQESMFSGLNNVEVYSLLREEYGQYFGFTEAEVQKLIAETNPEIPLAPIKEWYNGYRIGAHMLYNPWSILSCLKNNGKLKAYWLHTAGTELLSRLLMQSGSEVKTKLEELLQGKQISCYLSENLVFPQIDARPEALWSLLLYAGYLNVLSSTSHGGTVIAQGAIPNKEVSFVYDEIIEQCFSERVGMESYHRFIRSFTSGNMEHFRQYLSNYILQSGSYFDFTTRNAEQIFHVFVLGLVVGLRDRYVIRSNEETGFGRCDVTFLPKDKTQEGIILEFKTAETEAQLLPKAESALAQIKEKAYLSLFAQHGVKTVRAVGLSFCGKKMELLSERVTL